MMVVSRDSGVQLNADTVDELSHEMDLLSNGTMPLASLSNNAINLITNEGTFLWAHHTHVFKSRAMFKKGVDSDCALM